MILIIYQPAGFLNDKTKKLIVFTRSHLRQYVNIGPQNN